MYGLGGDERRGPVRPPGSVARRTLTTVSTYNFLKILNRFQVIAKTKILKKSLQIFFFKKNTQFKKSVF